MCSMCSMYDDDDNDNRYGVKIHSEKIHPEKITTKTTTTKTTTAAIKQNKKK